MNAVTTSTKARDWPAVTRQHPCPNCGKPDRCKVSPDGSRGYCFRIDAAGAYYSVTGGIPHTTPLPRSPRPLPVNRADPDTLDAVYRALLSVLDLSEQHRTQLHRRGFTDEQIEQRGYRTLPPNSERARTAITKRVQVLVPDAPLNRIPGFASSAGGGYTFISDPGLLVPAVDEVGRVLGFQDRRDDADDGAKYKWVSSSGRPDGTSSGAPVHVAFPVELRDPTIYATEGILKADYAADTLGAIVIGVPGVSNWRAALPVLAALQPEAIVVAYDMDLLTNQQVLANRDAFADALAAEGYAVTTTDWDLAEGKGIDDLLAEGGTFALVDWIPSDPVKRATDRANYLEAKARRDRAILTNRSYAAGERIALVIGTPIVAATSPDPDGRREVTYAYIGKIAGIDGQTVGRAFEDAEDAGAWRIESEPAQNGKRVYEKKFLYIDDPSIVTLQERVAAFKRDRTRKKADPQPQPKPEPEGTCPDCGDAGIRISCLGCGQIITEHYPDRHPCHPSQFGTKVGDGSNTSPIGTGNADPGVATAAAVALAPCAICHELRELDRYALCRDCNRPSGGAS